MTPDNLALIADSTATVAGSPTAFAEAFYGRLFALAPEVRALFPDDLTGQSDKLIDEIVFLANAAGDLDRFLGEARDLGVRHAGYGVEPAFYVLVEDALLHTLELILADGWSAELASAWRSLYRLIAEAMLDGASSQLFS